MKGQFISCDPKQLPCVWCWSFTCPLSGLQLYLHDKCCFKFNMKRRCSLCLFFYIFCTFTMMHMNNYIFCFALNFLSFHNMKQFFTPFCNLMSFAHGCTLQLHIILMHFTCNLENKKNILIWRLNCPPWHLHSW